MLEQERAFSTVHEGAVYLHRGETYLAETLDLGDRVALVTPFDGPWYTQPRRETDTSIVRALAGPVRCCGVELSYGEVEVSDQVVAYERRSLPEGRRLDTVPLDLPARQFATRALWFVPPDELMEEVGGDLLGALHAAEHALISVLPLLAMCDRWDIGGLSTNLHPQTLRPTVFVYDGHAGGVGIAQRGHDRFAELVASAARVVGDCRCRDGCPSCVQSPKCGNLNEMLDKGAAARLLGAMHARSDVPAARVSRRSSEGAAELGAHALAHGQRPEPQQRVLRRRAQPLALGAVGAAGALAAGPAARIRRQRRERARELRARPVELILEVGLAHVRHGAQRLACEAVDVPQQQQIAIGRPHGGERVVGGERHAVLDAREVVLARRGRRAPRELVEAALAHERVEPVSRLRRLASCHRDRASRPPARPRGSARRRRGRPACARRRRRAASRSAPRASRRPRPPCRGRYRLRRRTFSTVIRPTPPTTYGTAATRPLAHPLLGVLDCGSQLVHRADQPLARGLASARLRSVSLAHAVRASLRSSTVALASTIASSGVGMPALRTERTPSSANTSGDRAGARRRRSAPRPRAARRAPARRSRRTGTRAAPAARTGSRRR